MAKQTSSRKLLIRVFVVILAVLAFLGIVLGALALIDRALKGKTSEVSGLESVDYDENIFEDEAYLRLNRSVFYAEYGSGEALTEEDYRQKGVASEFFYEFFDAVICGDAAGYRSMLTENYLSENDVPERFSMQRLYDIRVDQVQEVSQTEYKGATAYVYYFEVQYKIFKNNGSFRNDIGSNQSVTQYYELYDLGGRMLLNAVTTKQVVKK